MRTFPLAQPMRELYDVFEVPGAGGIPLYSWWQVSVNSLAGREEKKRSTSCCASPSASTKAMCASTIRWDGRWTPGV